MEFVPALSTRLLCRILGRIRSGPALPIFDVEDGFWDPLDAARTVEIKARAREVLIGLCTDHPDQVALQPVALRINGYSTPEFERDLPVVAALAEIAPSLTILLSKANSATDLMFAMGRLSEHGVSVEAIVPLLETAQGIGNVRSICALAGEFDLKGIVYGIFDYHLEAGVFPFPTQTDAPHWEMVSALVGCCRDHGLSFVHPPYPGLRDVSGIQTIVRQLRHLCGSKFTILSAGPTQTPLLVQAIRDSHERSLEIDPESPGAAASLTDAEKRRIAMEIVEAFGAHLRSELSFTSDARRSRFIPPHEYLAARNYLERSTHA
jgi:citrate lyase beta subunit